jgi:hypothetical protein
VYMGHRRWLLRTHKYRKMADSFDGKIEKDSFAPQPATGRTVFEMCQKVNLNLVRNQKVMFMIIQKGKEGGRNYRKH